MKIRNGFVSNSSSSSFIIYSKEKPSIKHFEKIFKIDSSHILSFLSKEIAQIFENNTEKFIENSWWFGDDMSNEINKMEKEGYSVYTVNISNENGQLEGLIYDSGIKIDYKDKNFIMKNDD